MTPNILILFYKSWDVLICGAPHLRRDGSSNILSWLDGRRLLHYDSPGQIEYFPLFHNQVQHLHHVYVQARWIATEACVFSRVHTRQMIFYKQILFRIHILTGFIFWKLIMPNSFSYCNPNCQSDQWLDDWELVREGQLTSGGQGL